jgi:hypothetical protein
LRKTQVCPEELVMSIVFVTDSHDAKEWE